MAGLSRFSAQLLFDRTLNPSTRERPNFLALHKGPIDDESYGNEVDYSGYARQTLNSMYATIIQVGDGEVTLQAMNGNPVDFPVSLGPITNITHWAIWDSQTIGEGNVLYSGSLGLNRYVNVSDQPSVKAGAIEINFI